MKHHRERCVQWQNRLDPVGITVARRKQTRAAHALTPEPHYPICIECRRRLDHHEPTCSWNQGEIIRRAALVKHDIDPEDFDVLLKILAKRYRE
jgi:hypothetical protein